MRYLNLLALCALFSLGQAFSEEEHVRASLRVEHSAVAPGAATTLAVRFKLTPQWHLYWTNPGDSGDSPQVELTLPKGITAGEIHWPLPVRKVEAGLLGHLYEEELVLLVPLTVGADVAPGAHPFKAKLGWLVCKDVCLMGGTDLTGQLTVGETKADAEAKALFASARGRLPRAPKDGELSASWEGDTLTLRVPGATSLTFFPELEPEAAELIKSGFAKGDSLTVRFPELPKAPSKILGMLRVKRADTTEGLRVDIAAPARTN